MAKPSKLDVKSFSLSAGITWGLALLALGWASIFGWGNAFVTMASSVYVGYAATWVGGIVGGIEGFICAAITGAIFAWLYNAMAGK